MDVIIKRKQQVAVDNKQEIHQEERRTAQAAVQNRMHHLSEVVVLQCGLVVFPPETTHPVPLEIGTEVRLRREPDNPVDRWAIEVFAPDGTRMGYLPSQKNQSVARLIDAGKTIRAVIADSSVESYQPALRTFLPQENPLFPLTLTMTAERN